MRARFQCLVRLPAVWRRLERARPRGLPSCPTSGCRSVRWFTCCSAPPAAAGAGRTSAREANEGGGLKVRIISASISYILPIIVPIIFALGIRISSSKEMRKAPRKGALRLSKNSVFEPPRLKPRFNRILTKSRALRAQFFVPCIIRGTQQGIAVHSGKRGWLSHAPVNYEFAVQIYFMRAAARKVKR